MPFTGSHPAAIVPLLRTGLVPSALVIGSMVPDLPYFVPVSIPSTLTHSGAGVVSIDIVLGVVVFALWHLLLVPAAVGLAPAGLRDRLAPELPAPGRSHVRSVGASALVLVSLAIGAATHVAWDSFTHPDRWGSERIAWLAASHGPLEGYRWMQYTGGILGAAVVVIALARWWARTALTPGAQRVPTLARRDAAICAAIVGTSLVAGFLAGLASGLADGGLRAGAFGAATWGGGAGAAASLACAAACVPRLRVAS